MDEWPKCSIIIPVKPGGRVKALDALAKSDYPAGAVEALVAEGRQPSRQRNRAAALATGDLIYFLDDDSLVAPGFLKKTIPHYRDPAVAAVGGPSLTPESDGILQRSFGLAFASALGGGAMRNRYRQTGAARPTSDRELILCNLSFRRALFLQQGGFDERLYPNEENELLERIDRGGGRLIHDPGLAVYRSQRPSLGAFCRQLYGYGRGRGEQTLLSGVVSPVTFVPSLFLCYLLLLPLLHKAVYYLPLLCYLILVLVMTGYETARQRDRSPALLLPLIFPLFHLCYGLGMIRGLYPGARREIPAAKEEVSVRLVKEFGGGWNVREESQV
ncbi:MAG TPA: glycosyltransferase family 2 protein [Geobacteraceae bacterium]